MVLALVLVVWSIDDEFDRVCALLCTMYGVLQKKKLELVKVVCVLAENKG